jgi:hypothetical protein
MSEVTVEQLEKQLEFNKHMLDRRTAALRLANNSDFRRIVMEGFCKEDCARYVQESGDPALSAENRADALAMAQASGHLRRYLSLQVQLASTAERNIADIEEALAEVRAEEGAL